MDSDDRIEPQRETLGSTAPHARSGDVSRAPGGLTDPKALGMASIYGWMRPAPASEQPDQAPPPPPPPPPRSAPVKEAAREQLPLFAPYSRQNTAATVRAFSPTPFPPEELNTGGHAPPWSEPDAVPNPVRPSPVRKSQPAAAFDDDGTPAFVQPPPVLAPWSAAEAAKPGPAALRPAPEPTSEPTPEPTPAPVPANIPAAWQMEPGLEPDFEPALGPEISEPPAPQATRREQPVAWEIESALEPFPAEMDQYAPEPTIEPAPQPEWLAAPAIETPAAPPDYLDHPAAQTGTPEDDLGGAGEEADARHASTRYAHSGDWPHGHDDAAPPTAEAEAEAEADAEIQEEPQPNWVAPLAEEDDAASVMDVWDEDAPQWVSPASDELAAPEAYRADEAGIGHEPEEIADGFVEDQTRWATPPAEPPPAETRSAETRPAATPPRARSWQDELADMPDDGPEPPWFSPGDYQRKIEAERAAYAEADEGHQTSTPHEAEGSVPWFASLREVEEDEPAAETVHQPFEDADASETALVPAVETNAEAASDTAGADAFAPATGLPAAFGAGEDHAPDYEQDHEQDQEPLVEPEPSYARFKPYYPGVDASDATDDHGREPAPPASREDDHFLLAPKPYSAAPDTHWPDEAAEAEADAGANGLAEGDEQDEEGDPQDWYADRVATYLDTEDADTDYDGDSQAADDFGPLPHPSASEQDFQDDGSGWATRYDRHPETVSAPDAAAAPFAAPSAASFTDDWEDEAGSYAEADELALSPEQPYDASDTRGDTAPPGTSQPLPPRAPDLSGLSFRFVSPPQPVETISPQSQEKAEAILRPVDDILAITRQSAPDIASDFVSQITARAASPAGRSSALSNTASRIAAQINDPLLDERAAAASPPIAPKPAVPPPPPTPATPPLPPPPVRQISTPEISTPEIPAPEISAPQTSEDEFAEAMARATPASSRLPFAASPIPTEDAAPSPQRLAFLAPLLESVQARFQQFRESRAAPAPRQVVWPPPPSTRQRMRRALAVGVALVLVVGGVTSTWLSSGPAGPATVAGTVAAPLIPLYATETGHVAQISADQGDQLPAGHEIMTIRGNHPDASVRNDLQSRLDAAQDRSGRLARQVAELDKLASDIRIRKQDGFYQDQLAEIRQRLDGLHSQQADVSTEIDTLRHAMVDEEARLAGAGPQVVTADRDSVLWLLQASNGMPVQRGTPVAQIADCDHLFIQPQAGLKAGSMVMVRVGSSQGVIPAQVLAATASQAASTAPSSANHLFVKVNKGMLQRIAGDTCPLGRAVTITPVQKTNPARD